VGTRENQNNEIGVPLTLLSVQNEDFCVVEMGMRAKGEIEWLSYIAEPEMAIITSSGTSHIERLGSKENIFMAKTEILKYTKAFAILPNTRDFCELDCKNLKKIHVGNNTECCLSEIEQTNEELKFKINGKEFLIRSTLSHNAQNALFAYAVGKNYGLTDEEVKKGLMNWKQHENRGGLFFYKGVKVISDCYNASYESVIGAISSLSQQGNNGCKIAVLLGDMLELGENSPALHYAVGEYFADAGVDMIVSFGERAEKIADGFASKRGEENVLRFSDRSDALAPAKALAELLSEGDVLILKASRMIAAERVAEELKKLL
jgi:UDP-N-acetylmuramoyl-tripeptide--D-alanyl-D-alanine ligase